MSDKRFYGNSLRCPDTPFFIEDKENLKYHYLYFKNDEMPYGHKTLIKIVNRLNQLNEENKELQEKNEQLNQDFTRIRNYLRREKDYWDEEIEEILKDSFYDTVWWEEI